MGNSLRCCLACVLPCGALDLIRIVHLNGYVEEITRPVTAGQILQSYPNHVLTKPSSNGNNNMVRKIMILSSQSELKRGTIYFLIPDSSLPSDHSKSRKCSSKNKINGHKIIHDNHGIGKSKVCDVPDNDMSDNNNNITKNSKFLSLDLSTLDNKENNETKLKSKSKLGKHQRRRSSRGKSGIWQPHLESITEDL